MPDGGISSSVSLSSSSLDGSGRTLLLPDGSETKDVAAGTEGVGIAILPPPMSCGFCLEIDVPQAPGLSS